MNARVLLMGGALLAATACDRGASLFEKAEQAEKSGKPDEARWQYQTILTNHPDSKKFPDAKRAYVRLSLDSCERSLNAGDPNSCRTRLDEAQPLLDPADKARFDQLAAAEKGAQIQAAQSVEIRQFTSRVAALAGEEARAHPQIEQQAAFKWDEFVAPSITPVQRSYLHLGKIGELQRESFDFGLIKRLAPGRYVLSLNAKTPFIVESIEWYVQLTTAGWRIVCAQKEGANDCQNAWLGAAKMP